MDVVGSADPYFVAKIDDRISFVCVSELLYPGAADGKYADRASRSTL